MKIAAVTMTHNESLFLPIWSHYYSGQVGEKNLFVIDHGSDDGSTDALPRAANLIRLPRQHLDEYDRPRIVGGLVQMLLTAYDIVIFGDTDELIVADPSHFAGLADFYATAPDVTAPVGLNVFQHTMLEQALDPRLPILGQRRFCQFKSDFCKPIIVRRPITWTPGFHFCDAPVHQANDLYLFHLKSIDATHSLARLARTRAMAWAESNLQNGLSHHQRADDDFHMKDSFHAPRMALEAAPDTTFDFSADLARKKAEPDQSPFAGVAAEIPPRFFGSC